MILNFFKISCIYFILTLCSCSVKSKEASYIGNWRFKEVNLEITSEKIIFNNKQNDFLNYTSIPGKENTYKFITDIEDGAPWIVKVIYHQNDTLKVFDNKFNKEYVLVKE